MFLPRPTVAESPKGKAPQGTAELASLSEEKHEPASDINTAVVDSLKALDLKRPIREADMLGGYEYCRQRSAGLATPSEWLDLVF